MLRQVDKLIDPTNLQTDIPATLNTLLKVEGKFADFAKLSALIKIKLMSVSHDKNQGVSKHQHDNRLHEDQQPKRLWLTLQAKQDLRFLRALAANIMEHKLPLEDPRKQNSLSAEVVVFCDASGDIRRPAYCGALITRGSLHPHDIALSYALPYIFLTAKDSVNYNHHNTILLELLSILATVLELGPILSGRSIMFVTDSLSLVAVMRNNRVPDGTNAALALQTLLELTVEAQISLRVKWKRRNSCTWTTAADTLSHAAFTSLPLQRMPNLACRKLPFPEPLQHTLMQAALNPPNGFPALKQRTEDFWRAKNWHQRLWAYP